ncbi:MAG: hypothetical protein PVF85_10565 [Anaerolineales bacterium]|jgi:hypothetical protein
MLRSIVWRIIRGLGVSPFVLRCHPRSGLANLGWYESFRTQAAIDRNDQPLPWYTYSAIHFLEERLNPDLRVFEFGSGNSTLWYSKRVKQVIAVESDPDWQTHIASQLTDNNSVSLREIGHGYIHEPKLYEPFDVVVIDGFERTECAPVAVKCLAEGGVIIWDDSDWEEHQSGYDYLTSQGYAELKFFGMAPITFLSSQTSIFYRSGHNVLGI